MVRHHILHLMRAAVGAEGVPGACHIHLRILSLIILLVLHVVGDALLAPHDAILIILLWILMLLLVGIIGIVLLGARRNKLLGVLRLICIQLVLQHQKLLRLRVIRWHGLIGLLHRVPSIHHVIAAILTVMPSCPAAAVVTDRRDRARLVLVTCWLLGQHHRLVVIDVTARGWR